MIEFLYPTSYFASTLGLVLWFYFKDNRVLGRLMQQLFMIGIGVYAVSFLLSPGIVSQKLWILFRDLMVMGIVAQLLNVFRKHKAIFFGSLAVLIAVYFYKYESVLKTSFVATATQDADISLDQEGELLVEVANDHQASELSTVLEKYDLTTSPAFSPASGGQTDLDDYIVVNIPDNQIQHIEAIKEDLRETGLVDWLEENEILTISPIESIRKAPSTKKKYGIDDPELNKLWGFEVMKVDELYKYLKLGKIKAKKRARIFILDTGVDAKHEDLKDNYTSLKTKYDNDGMQHGTHCAGIAASVSNNSRGIASFSPNNSYVQVTSIKVLGSSGAGTQRTIINGIIEAADNGADVISMSLGGRANGSRQKAYENAVAYANKKGAIVVAAAGNSNSNAKDYAPANTPGIITVSAIDSEKKRATFSNYVNNVKMGIAAPGVNIYSTVPGNKYASFNGTSMATPYVAGLIGLMRSINPTLSTQEVYQILSSTGIDTQDTKNTGKLIMPAEAVKAVGS